VLKRYVTAAARAAVVAGSFLARHLGQAKTIRTKRSNVDLVTELDRAAERLLRARLRRVDPAFGFLGEELGLQQPDAPYRWVVDPLDGTMNFVHGLPIFGVSIGLQQRIGISSDAVADVERRSDGPILIGVIYDPIRRELFTATRGGGSFVNGRRIRVSTTTSLRQGLLSTGFPSRSRLHPQPYLGWFRGLHRLSHGVRRIGSTVWCLAALAAGRLDGFYEQDLWPWDIAAGLLLVEEAGGCVTDFAGRPPRLARGQLVASNGRIHRALLRALARLSPPSPS
jgi:myo-inositol-1(or 4)-monophosphatase